MKIAFSVLYLLHESMKWVSSSIMFGQNLQNLSSLVTGGLLCLPFSMAKQWSLSRSFVSVRLCVLFLTRGRYFSHATFVL